MRLIFCLETILETLFNLAMFSEKIVYKIFFKREINLEITFRKKVTKIVLVDAFTFSK